MSVIQDDFNPPRQRRELIIKHTFNEGQPDQEVEILEVRESLCFDDTGAHIRLSNDNGGVGFFVAVEDCRRIIRALQGCIGEEV